ncbi:hypothetical protein AB0C33_01965 [Nonomuraea sp. NPDC048881]|uniref:hypothetical protein n=1 Tax=Nonomuraea sp. NPDC048881 TaxID=3155030 RepID=UPI0033E49481
MEPHEIAKAWFEESSAAPRAIDQVLIELQAMLSVIEDMERDGKNPDRSHTVKGSRDIQAMMWKTIEPFLEEWLLTRGYPSGFAFLSRVMEAAAELRRPHIRGLRPRPRLVQR